jgi:hypothetical protein
MRVYAIIAAAFLAGCAAEKPVTPPPASPPAANKAPDEEGVLKIKYEAEKAKVAANTSTQADLVRATVAYATAVMNGSGPPRVKYGKALDLYNEALKLDHNNEEAKNNRDLILSIYKQMGRTPPSSGK